MDRIYNYITGRVNVHQITEEDPIESCEADLILFAHHFGEYDFIITFEDKKKCGLLTHPHYHFIFRIPAEENTKKIRASMRKWLTDTGYVKYLSSVKITDTPELAYHYVLKFQEVFLTNMDDAELGQLLKSSAVYNTEIVINNWSEHLEEIVKQLGTYFNDEKTYTRRECLKYMHKYIVEWNAKCAKSAVISFQHLHHLKIVSVFNYIESKILDLETAFWYLDIDCMYVTGEKK